MMKELRCIHRHTIKEHPACFVKGLVKGSWIDEKEFVKATGLPWYSYPEYRIGYLDIETDDLNADIGNMLSWAIKEKGGKVYYSSITREEIFNGTYDRRLVSDLLEMMKEFKIIIGYFSDRFDLPYVRSKALHYGFDFPGYGELYSWDLFFTARSKLKLQRLSLANVCEYLNISGKTPIRKETWKRARYGDVKAIKEVVEHNIADVEITEKLHDRLSFTRKWIRKSV